MATADKPTISVTCDGASDLGDMVVVARTNQVCRVPLLIGATYAVRASAPLTGIEVSDEYAEVMFNDDISLRSLYQSNPTSAARTKAAPSRAVASFDVVRPLGAVFVEDGSGAWRLGPLPELLGVEVVAVSGGCCEVRTNATGFAWNCRIGCDCGGSEQTLAATLRWCGYEREVPWAGYCPCHDNGEPPDPLAEWLSLDAPPTVMAGGDLYALSVGFAPPSPTNGTLRLDCLSGAEKIELFHGVEALAPAEFPLSFSVGGPLGDFCVRGLEPSESVGDVLLEWSYEESDGATHSVTDSLTVARVRWLHMTSAVAGASPNPPPFEGQANCAFAVTNSANPDRHLVVPFCNVVNTNDFTARDFAVDLRLELAPSGAQPIEGEVAEWRILEGTPDSGAFANISGLTAQFVNPKVGGVYRFAATCGGSPPTECTLVLPLAGASVDAVFAEDMAAADRVINRINNQFNSFFRQLPFTGDALFHDNGMGDYLGRVDCETQPTVWLYNQINDTDRPGMGAVATFHGLPIRMAKLSNFMVGYATTKMGVKSSLKKIAQYVGTTNDAPATMSWKAGEDVARGSNAVERTTRLVLEAWHVSDIKERRLWPNTIPTDNHVNNGDHINYNFNFCSPGFIEKGYIQ